MLTRATLACVALAGLAAAPVAARSRYRQLKVRCDIRLRAVDAQLEAARPGTSPKLRQTRELLQRWSYPHALSSEEIVGEKRRALTNLKAAHANLDRSQAELQELEAYVLG